MAEKKPNKDQDFENKDPENIGADEPEQTLSDQESKSETSASTQKIQSESESSDTGSQEESGESTTEESLPGIESTEETTNERDVVEDTNPVYSHHTDTAKPEGHDTKDDKQVDKTGGESNYQISLINENELTVKVKTLLPVEIESTSKEVSDQALSQKLLISRARVGTQREIEIKIKILDDGSVVYTDDILKSGKLIPNPEVEDLIVPEEQRELTPEEKLALKIGKNSPHNVFKRIYEQNFKIGLVSSIIIYLILVIAFAAYARKQSTPTVDDVKTRLVVLQDIPTRVNLENLQDPAKPEEIAESETRDDGVIPRRIPPRRNVFRPRTTRTDTQTTTDTSEVRVDTDTTGTGGLLADTTGVSDTAKTSAGELTQTFSENEIGLIMNFPDQWSVLKNTEVDPNKPFEGIIFADTTLTPGDLNIFVNLDKEGKEFNRDKFNETFEMEKEDIIAYQSRPLFAGDDTTFEYYLFLKNHKIHITVRLREQYYERMREVIENAVKTLYIEDTLPTGG